MKQLPIVLTGAEVIATLRSEKTQMRHLVSPQPEVSPKGNLYGEWLNRPLNGLLLPHLQDIVIECPFGQPGDRLWVREAFRFPVQFDDDSPARVADRCLDAGYRQAWAPIRFEADGRTRDWPSVAALSQPSDTPGRLRPARHMPIWASRLSLKIVSIRVERLQAISEADAIAEGMSTGDINPVGSYAELWDSLNAGRGLSWRANPWVWVVEFRRMEG
ncbi:hypothetical protein [Burkholderia gladioli]|uniref:hypothetical protein n=1 Tax=Burkholderia gladioli TaxID=28095 RepID=UPI001641E9D0|nr:hypothetical protein [Burkholderia gladioli]MBU9380697.1 hypothetical protein [Burkholderia gladioli]